MRVVDAPMPDDVIPVALRAAPLAADTPVSITGALRRAGASAQFLGEDADLRVLPDGPDLSRLYFAVEAARKGDAPLIVQFAGVSGGEGASTVAAAFARRCAHQSSRSVLVLRCGGLDPGGHAPDEPPQVLELTEDAAPVRLPAWESSLPPSQDRVRVANLGMTAENATPRKIRALADALRRHFEIVVLDCQPLARSPLAGALSGIADGTIIVAAAGRTRRAQLTRAAADFGRMGGQVVGVVLNRQKEWLPPWLRRRLG